MSRRDVQIHVSVRSSKDITALWKERIRRFFDEADHSDDEKSKLIVFTNFKSRVELAAQHVYNAAGLDRDLLVHCIDRNSSLNDKSVRINMFCGKIHHPTLAPISRAMVISASTGAEGYDSPLIRLVIREGMPSSIEQMSQEIGRIRSVANASGSDYHLYLSLDDYEGMRSIWKRESRG